MVVLRFEGFEVVFPGDVGSDSGSTGGVRVEPDEIAPSPTAAVGNEAVEPPADHSAPVGGFAISSPAEAIAIYEVRYLDTGKNDGQVGGGGWKAQLGERSEGFEGRVADSFEIGSEEVCR